jgi:hypothetical protein
LVSSLVTLPGNLGSHILDNFAYGVVASTPINDHGGSDTRLGQADSDLLSGSVITEWTILLIIQKMRLTRILAIVPVKLDGIALTPFGAYGRSGKYDLTG